MVDVNCCTFVGSGSDCAYSLVRVDVTGGSVDEECLSMAMDRNEAFMGNVELDSCNGFQLLQKCSVVDTLGGRNRGEVLISIHKQYSSLHTYGSSLSKRS